MKNITKLTVGLTGLLAIKIIVDGFVESNTHKQDAKVRMAEISETKKVTRNRKTGEKK